jgi:transcriptional regulator with XRE-family HTH domain
MYLEREGMTQKAIADRSGVSDFTLRRIVNGVGKKILPSTERAILAVQPFEAPRSGGRVDATGTRRRLGALMALGYTTVELSAMLNGARSKVSTAARAERVTIHTRAAVKDLYDRLSMTVPELTVIRARTRAYALKQGHLPPLEWDDDLIDDPGFVPEAPTVEDGMSLTRYDESLIDAALEGKRPALSPPERREAIAVLNERRWSARSIAKHIGCSAKTVERVRAELGLPIYLSSTPKNGRLAA